MTIHPDFLSPDNQEPRKFAGKYESVDQLEQGHLHLQGTLTERNQRIAELEAALAQQAGSLPDPRMQPNDRARDRLDRLGVPADAVTEVAREVVQEIMQPVLRGMEARTYMTQTYTDYPQVENQIVAFLQSNPELLSEYQRVYQTSSPRVAIEWAHDRWRAANQQPVRSTNPGDARMPPSSSNRLTHAQLIGQDEEAKRQDAWNEFVNTRNPREVLKQRLQGTTQQGHFNEGWGPYGR